jgi:uncharacterized protein (DUF433 family)
LRPREFWEAWFGLIGRESLEFNSEGKPYRVYLNNTQQFLELINKHHLGRLPVYITVQPFKAYDTPASLEKLFFEFDHPEDPQGAVQEALAFANSIQQFYHVDPLVCLSGRKGAHVYIWLREGVAIEGLLELARQTYKSLQLKLMAGLSLQTLDPKVIGDLKRLARVPFTIHEKSGKLCQPVDKEGKPVRSLEIQRHIEHGLDPDLLKPIVEELCIRQAKEPSFNKEFRVRGFRRQVRELIERVKNGHEPSHLERLIILFEMINNGCSDEEIHEVFKHVSDYKYEKTQYYIDHARKKGYKPFKTENIQKLVEGGS